MNNPFVLVDGSSYFFRAFHALPPLTNSKGQPTGAIYGVANMVKRLALEHQSDNIVVVFDAKGRTFRDELYPLYKAHRPSMPTELSSQFEPLLQVLQALGFPLLIVEGVEADDVIGTLAKAASAVNRCVLISTGDKDIAQLVNENITLINTMNQETLNIEGVKKKFGVYPEQMIDYLALVGDTSDNIPGIHKCGPKTAIKWLDAYQTLDNLVQHAHTITGKVGDYLRLGLDQLALSKQLVTIKTDVELSCTIEQLIRKPVNREQLILLSQEYEFKTWLKELTSQHSPAANTPPPFHQTLNCSYEIITTQTQLDQCLTQLHACSLFCIDTETTSLEAIDAQIVGISMAIQPDAPVYIPLAHQDGSPQLLKERVLAVLKPILENPMIGKIGQNLKYDYTVFKNYNITLCGIQYDTMLESYLLNSASARHDMDTLAQHYLNYQTIRFTDVAGTGKHQLRFDQVPVNMAAAYAAEDADITLKLHHAIYPKLDTSLQAVLHDIEVPLVSVLANMERQGVLIDDALLAQHGIRLKARILELQAQAFELAGKSFNLNSPKQLQDILFVEQQLPIQSKTPKGQPSTAESVLQELALDYPLPAVILEYRSLSKLVSTYIDALPKRIHPKTHRVHTSYNQAVTTTGRLSSSEPNLQNIPIRTEEGRLIRRAFIAPVDHVLLTADYSQIELRIMAHLSQDSNLLNAFTQGLDIHTATASEIFDVALNDVTFEQRRRAKAVNFGLIYGMSAFGLSRQLGVTRLDAQQYIDRYFERYPGVLHYMETMRNKARTEGFVATLFGRRLYLPEINARNVMRQKAAERLAINAPMQGTAADIIKKAMLAVSAWQHQQATQTATMIMQVHDELVFEVHKNAIDSVKETIRHLMEHTVELSVPLLVSIGIGQNWDDAH